MTFYLANIVLKLALVWQFLVVVGSDNDREKLTCYEFSTLHQNENEKPNNLFGTKTTYETSQEAFLNSLNSSKWPVNNDQCSPVYIFFLSRHSIRYPKGKEISDLGKFLNVLRDELLRKGNFNPKFKDLIDWKLQMKESDDNHVSKSGVVETNQIGKRFYNYFPYLLNINSTKFSVGVTYKIRTTETADAFIDGMIEEQIKKNTPPEKLQLTVKEIKNDKFVKVDKDNLMSHRTCKKIMAQNNIKLSKHSPTYNNLVRSEVFSHILLMFSQRNNLEFTLTFDSVILIYKACIYEIAILYSSPWCQMFSKEELEIIEYLRDIDDYHNSHNFRASTKLACTVIKDLYKELKSVIDTPDNSNTKATLYFSHENLMSKMFSFLKLFDYFPNSTNSYSSICFPMKREWRSSYILPFGSNFAAVLYKCKEQSQLKLLTLVNEVPVTVKGCSSAFCNIDDFLKEYSFVENDCNLDDICKRN